MNQKLDPVTRDICGDRKGWNAHNRHKERQCGPCLKANAAYMRDYRRRHGLTTSTLYTSKQVDAIKEQAVTEALRAARARQLPRHARRLLVGRSI